jgi:hypothetical protein
MVSEMTRSDPNSQHGGQSVGGMATGLCHYRGVSSSCAVLAMACLSRGIGLGQWDVSHGGVRHRYSIITKWVSAKARLRSTTLQSRGSREGIKAASLLIQ